MYTLLRLRTQRYKYLHFEMGRKKKHNAKCIKKNHNIVMNCRLINTLHFF